MATTYTDNLNLQQPDLDDDALITVINNDMAIIDKAVNGVQDGLAIVANGNTHVAISAGQFVYVRNHTTLTEGLYVASSNIAANATLSTSNLTADAAGGLNLLNGKTMQANETISDCNNAVNGRAYNFVNNTLHKPSFDYGTLFQIGTMLNSSAYKMQIACDVVDNHIAFRRTPNNSWGNEAWNELALNDKRGWTYFAAQSALNGSDAVAYPADAKEIYLENGDTYAQFVIIPVNGTATYYYGGFSADNYIAVHIDRSTRKVWVYAGKNSGSALSSASSVLFYR